MKLPSQSGKYRCLIVDPPWNQRKTGKRRVRPNQTTCLDYKTMSQKELEDLPIKEWAAHDAFLWLWATNSKDKDTKQPVLKMALDLMDIWGFTYYTMITWHKKTGPCPFGPYQVTTEHVLFGYKGKANFPKASLGKMQTCFTEASTGHSIKPSSFYEQINKWFEGPKLDVFARQIHEGFDGWGDEYNLVKPTESQIRLKSNHHSFLGSKNL